MTAPRGSGESLEPRQGSNARWVVIVTRIGVDEGGTEVESVTIGPFRRVERADARAATVNRFARKYDEPADTLHVTVERLRDGKTSAQDAMDLLYGAIV